ncbi:hypothetical protein F0562_020535 [Nyssa sinensis]|uniref:RING-type domain-containing protein n=1 Tax=Nyssa sinensis TaxID=561372 RepID=A0A5J5BTT5_9ASTE|nr:hypothetical protein F0562_020535 [Nyssa sinensis]
MLRDQRVRIARGCFASSASYHGTQAIGDRNDIEFGELVERKKWMRCPHCNYCIELTQGCRIIKCRCGTNFCYECGRNMNHQRCDCNTNSRTCCLRFCLICIAWLIIFLICIALLIFFLIYFLVWGPQRMEKLLR